jgi:molybdenum ABC transporter molybdate-binding protein
MAIKKAKWSPDWRVRVRVWVERNGQAVLGEGRAELLAAIDIEHSITRAAKAAGMSYRRAWNMIQEVNEAAGQLLVEAAVGGKLGGGARLTDAGRMSLAVYEEVRQSLNESAAGILQRAIRPELDTSIHLAAAISLQEAVGQILAEYTLRMPGVRVRAVFGASNELADQILAGAPGDVFISAEPGELDRLQAAKLIVKGSRKLVAKNGLAVVGGPKSKAIAAATDLLSARFKRVAIAEPACPLGGYSKAYLEKSQVYDALLPKVLFVDNSRAVLAAVASGAAQAGVAFSSDASAVGAWQRLFAVPASQATSSYEAAVLDRGRLRKESQALCRFLSSADAARCYRRCGLRSA